MKSSRESMPRDHDYRDSLRDKESYRDRDRHRYRERSPCREVARESKRDRRRADFDENPHKGPYTYIPIQNDLTGVVIGKNGETVRMLQNKYEV